VFSDNHAQENFDRQVEMDGVPANARSSMNEYNKPITSAQLSDYAVRTLSNPQAGADKIERSPSM